MTLVAVSIELNEVDSTRPRNIFHNVERAVIEQALLAHHGNISDAARALGVFRTSLQRRMSKLGMRGRQ